MDILIPVETSSRELLYKIYLCRLLASQGFRCYLGRKTQINYLMNCLSGFIYLDKGYHSGESEKLYKIIKQNNGFIVSLDEEGGVDFADNSTLLNRYSKQFFRQVDFTFLWGPKQYELIKGNLTDLFKVEITGHPRFEMLKPEYHYLYQDEITQIKKEHGKFVLINTNMGFGNNIKGDSFVVSNYGGRFNKIDKIISFDKEKLNLYICLIKELSEKTRLNIVLRPHPEESHQVYLDALRGVTNIEVISSGSVIPWLLAAEQMIHPDCTTAIESCLLGKRAYSFLPENYPKDLTTTLPIAASEVFVDAETMIECINNPQPIKAVESNNLVNGYFSIESQSFDKIVTKLISIKKARNGVCHKIILRDRLWMYVKLFRSKFFLGKKEELVNNKLKGFDWRNIDRVNSVIKAHNNPQKEININTINSELFVFSCFKL